MDSYPYRTGLIYKRNLHLFTVCTVHGESKSWKSQVMVKHFRFPTVFEPNVNNSANCQKQIRLSRLWKAAENFQKKNSRAAFEFFNFFPLSYLALIILNLRFSSDCQSPFSHTKYLTRSSKKLTQKMRSLTRNLQYADSFSEEPLNSNVKFDFQSFSVFILDRL